MEDIRLGRRTQSRMVRAQSNGITPVSVLGADADRIAVTFSVDNPAGGVTIWLQTGPGLNTGTQTGIQLAPGMPPITFTMADHGDAVRGQWAIQANGNIGITILETILHEQ